MPEANGVGTGHAEVAAKGEEGDSSGSSSVRSRSKKRSRSPRRMKPSRKPRLKKRSRSRSRSRSSRKEAGDSDMVIRYCRENDLDSAAELAFREQPIEIRQRIVDEGPCTGSNKSAVLMSRIRRHVRETSGAYVSPGGITQSNQHTQTLEEFIKVNELDDSAVEALEAVSEEMQRRVIDEGIVTGRNKSAILIGRIRRCVAGGAPTQSISRHTGMPSQPTSKELIEDMERFIHENNLDDYAEQALKDQKPAVLATVLAEGPITGESKSKILMGRIRRAQQLSRSGGHSDGSSNQQYGGYGMHGGMMMPYGCMPPVDQFISENQLDHLASREFRALNPQQQMMVISEGNITGSNKSAVMMGRIRKAQKDGGGMPPDGSMQQMVMMPMQQMCGYHPMMQGGHMPMQYGMMDPNMMMMGGAYGGMPMMAPAMQMVPMMCYPPGMGGMPMMQPMMHGGASSSMHGPASKVDQFVMENGLDSSAARTLKEQPLDTQERVVAEGFLTGNNKSAVLMSRIRRIASGGNAPADVTAAVAARAAHGSEGPGRDAGEKGDSEDNIGRFVRENHIDTGAEKVLREQRPVVRQLVLDEGPISGGNRSAILISRIRRIERTL